LDQGVGVRTSLTSLAWIGLTDEPSVQRERGFVAACAFRRAGGGAVMLARGADPGAVDTHGMTGLHWAAANGHLGVVKTLLARGAPLEAGRADSSVLASKVGLALRYL